MNHRLAWCLSAAIMCVSVDATNQAIKRKRRQAFSVSEEDTSPISFHNENELEFWEDGQDLTKEDLERLLGTDNMSFSMPDAPCRQQDPDERIFNLLLEFSEEVELMLPTTPQGKTYRWLNTLDTEMSVCEDRTAFVQMYALGVFYFSTGGPYWTKAGGWLLNDQYCTWYGLTCDDSGVLFELMLESNNLRGGLPDELGCLDGMESFGIYKNHVAGELPSTLSMWSNLRLLDVEHNELSGPAFPARMSQWRRLERYQISHNKFTGKITRAFNQVPHLEKLWIAENQITGTIPPTIRFLESLDSFVFYKNSISGNIPRQIGTLNLTSFLGYDNFLAGRIPTELFENTNLIDLRLEKNGLAGRIPSEIGNLKYIQSLRLGDNNIGGRIPTQIENLSNLVILSLNGTRLSGPIPDAFEDYSQLEYIDLSRCSLQGRLPRTLFDVSTVKAIYLDGNQLRGRIPDNYLNSDVLHDLYLNENLLTGTIPAIEDGSMNQLQELLLDNNNLVGTMPASICELHGFEAMVSMRAVTKQEFILTVDHCTQPPEVLCSCCQPCTIESR